jgi:hypothetical protein
LNVGRYGEYTSRFEIDGMVVAQPMMGNLGPSYELDDLE